MESIRLPQLVEFNPLNPEHQTAMFMLIFHGRQHPTLRFFVDPTEADNVPAHMVRRYLSAFVSTDVKRRAKQICDQQLKNKARRVLAEANLPDIGSENLQGQSSKTPQV
jgi:hypothetical protein